MTITDRRSATTAIGWWLDLDPLDHRLPDRWLSWASSPGGGRVLTEWRQRHPSIAGWTATDLANPASGPRTDAMQATVVSLAQRDSAEAGITLLVQLRPGLVRLARAACGWEWISNHDVSDEVQATFFEVLYRHDLERRPNRIAANLLLDTRQKLWRRVPRSGPPTVSLAPSPSGGTSPDQLAAAGSGATEPAWVAGIELRLHLQESVNGLPGSDASRQLTATMAYRAWIEDESTSAIAADLGVAPQTVATRLYRLRRILRAGW